jgi:hypothetical protein
MNDGLRRDVQALLDRKAEIDRRNKETGTHMVSHEFWLIDAVKLLLQIQMGEK